ncbi:hypothetical protein [Planktotalea sp.]|uniref:hypothetical protein n=1 Tax=Planktotalea sp. TaxID=2029877 RepID=UPI0032967E79
MRKFRTFMALCILAKSITLPNTASAQDLQADLNAFVERTNECITLEKSDPGGLDALATCRWVYDDIIRYMSGSKHSKQMLNMMLYLAVLNNNALLSSATHGKTEVNKITCQYISERRQFKQAYALGATSHLDNKMKIIPLPQDVAAKCSAIFSETK